jgi:hypothetical protein
MATTVAMAVRNSLARRRRSLASDIARSAQSAHHPWHPHRDGRSGPSLGVLCGKSLYEENS